MTADLDLVERVVGEVEGYPYFIQLWGAELWDAAEGPVGTFRLARGCLTRSSPIFTEGLIQTSTKAEFRR